MWEYFEHYGNVLFFFGNPLYSLFKGWWEIDFLLFIDIVLIFLGISTLYIGNRMLTIEKIYSNKSRIDDDIFFKNVFISLGWSVDSFNKNFFVAKYNDGSGLFSKNSLGNIYIFVNNKDVYATAIPTNNRGGNAPPFRILSKEKLKFFKNRTKWLDDLCVRNNIIIHNHSNIKDKSESLAGKNVVVTIQNSAPTYSGWKYSPFQVKGNIKEVIKGDKAIKLIVELASDVKGRTISGSNYSGVRTLFIYTYSISDLISNNNTLAKVSYAKDSMLSKLSKTMDFDFLNQNPNEILITLDAKIQLK